MAADARDGGGPAPFPWEAAMEAGLARLRIPARDFWRMTPRELAATLGPATAPPGRATLRRLMADFPDAAP